MLALTLKKMVTAKLLLIYLGCLTFLLMSTMKITAPTYIKTFPPPNKVFCAPLDSARKRNLVTLQKIEEKTHTYELKKSSE